MKRTIAGMMICIALLSIAGCSSNSISQEKEQQEKLQAESVAQLGAPAIKNFREKRILKDIYELRDQDGLETWTYIIAQNTGELHLLGKTIGFPISAGIQYNNPKKTEWGSNSVAVIDQAEPNGLYQPNSDEGTWVMMLDEKTKKARPVYIEQRVVCSPFPLK